MSTSSLRQVAIQMHLERRVFGRRRAVWHAWIIPSTMQRQACCVRNVSEAGALLELKVPEWLPAHFDLLVEGCGLRLPCEMTHRGKHGVGVGFTDADLAQDLMDYCNLREDPSERRASTMSDRVAPPRLTSELIMNALRRK